MRTVSSIDRFQLSTLQELDSFVGRFVMGDSPSVYWMDSYAHLRFESLEEALSAMRDPYFQHFIPPDERAETVLAEVAEFPEYSSKITVALEIVQRLSAEAKGLQLKRETSGRWNAAFGAHSFAEGSTAPIAISLAALRARGMEVYLCDAAMAAAA